MQKRFEDILQALTDPKRLKLRLFIEGNVIGVLTGLTIALFRYLLELSEANLPQLYQFLQDKPVYILGWFIVLMAIGCILHWLLRMDGMISGSGIPQIKGVLMGKMDMHWARVLLLKFTGAVLGIGAGLSLGREGPSVQLGACLGQGVGRLIRHETDRGALVICDPRVVTKGYGKIFMGSLPKVRICKSVTELADFMKEISKDPK